MIRFRSYWNYILMLIVSVVLVSMMGITGCAPLGPKYGSAKNEISPLAKDKARIVFYRRSMFFGDGTRPAIFLDREQVGTSRPGTIFYVDVAPGKHLVKIPASVYSGETILDIEAARNEIIYLKSYMTGSAFAGRTNVSVMSVADAIAEIDDLEWVKEPAR